MLTRTFFRTLTRTLTRTLGDHLPFPGGGLLIAGLSWLLLSATADGQTQTLVTSPQVGITDSFYENYGVGGFGFRGGGPGGSAFFRRGPLGAAPAFGGFDPNAGANLGIGGGGFGGGGGLNFGFAQGSSRSLVGQSASVMTPNGGGGAIFSGSVRPFVTGIFPVVGARPTWISPVQQALRQMRPTGPSTARTSDAPLRVRESSESAPTRRPTMFRESAPAGSLTEMRQQHEREAAAQREEARQKILQARAAEAEGRLALARSHYRLAMRQLPAEDPWRPQIVERLQAIAAKRSNPSP